MRAILDTPCNLDSRAPVLPGRVERSLLEPEVPQLLVRTCDAARVGAAVWGVGFGWIYVAAKRNVIAPMLARMTFTVVLVILEGMRVV